MALPGNLWSWQLQASCKSCAIYHVVCAPKVCGGFRRLSSLDTKSSGQKSTIFLISRDPKFNAGSPDEKQTQAKRFAESLTRLCEWGSRMKRRIIILEPRAVRTAGVAQKPPLDRQARGHQCLTECQRVGDVLSALSHYSSYFSHTFPLRPISRDRRARVNGYDLLG